jgi:hypothetical protein
VFLGTYAEVKQTNKLKIIEFNVWNKFSVVNALGAQQGAQAAQGLEIKRDNFSVMSRPSPSPFPPSPYSSFLPSFPSGGRPGTSLEIF